MKLFQYFSREARNARAEKARIRMTNLAIQIGTRLYNDSYKFWGNLLLAAEDDHKLWCLAKTVMNRDEEYYEGYMVDEWSWFEDLIWNTFLEKIEAKRAENVSIDKVAVLSES